MTYSAIVCNTSYAEPLAGSRVSNPNKLPFRPLTLGLYLGASVLGGLATHSLADTQVALASPAANCGPKTPIITGTSTSEASSCAQPLNQTRQSQTLPSSLGDTQLPTFVLRKIVLKGATLLSEAELSQLYADKINQPITLADLETLTEKITRAYQNKNFFLAQAIIPANQDVTEGHYVKH